ncbi:MULTISPECIES: GtrA family protein [Paraburkholderia]|nr:GtrA family protein [Paraburkholderia hospita]SEI16714.1 Putative flippase GtrA (transmembrane translocase of bactoprenol-linked glucose) [Paraburkholderia hospita]
MALPDANRRAVNARQVTLAMRLLNPIIGLVLRHMQLIRFLIVGGINTLFGYSVFFVLTWMGLHYPLAIALATIAGVTFNFQSVGRLVFGGAPRSRFWRFVGVYCLIYLLNLGGVRALLEIGANVYVANAIVLLPLSLLAFLLNRRLVFSNL